MPAVNVSTTAVRLDTNSPDGLRPAFLAVYNEGPGVIYLGSTNAVLAADGFPLALGSSFHVDLNVTGAACWAISASGTNVAKTFQVGGS